MSLKAVLSLLLAAALLAACGRSTEALVPDTVPQISLARINGREARDLSAGYVLAPASEMYDPNSGATLPNSVPVEVTASDERQVLSVTISLADGEGGGWQDELTFDRDQEIFRNPFTFSVPFRGSPNGLRSAFVTLVATDDAGQVNREYSATVQVDGSLPVVSVTVPEEPQREIFLAYGQASDPESGLLELEVYLDGEPLSVQRGGSTFSATIDPSELFVGTHTLAVVAVNGVNEAAVVLKTFETLPEEDAPTP